MPITIAAIPAYVASEKGFWRDEGLEVQVDLYASGRAALDALLGGAAEVMSVSETPPIHAALQGHDVMWVATVAEHNEAKLTVRTDRISSPAEVRGRKIGTVPGTNSDFYMYQWLAAHKIPVNEVDVVAMKPPAMVQAFIRGDIDAMFAWEPHNYNAYSRQVHSKSYPTELYEGRHSVIMRHSYLEKHPDVAEKLIRGFIMAEQFVTAKPEEAKEIVRNITGIDRATLDALWGEYRVEVELDNDLIDILAAESKWAAGKAGTNDVDILQHIYSAALQAVSPNRVGTRVNSLR